MKPNFIFDLVFGIIMFIMLYKYSEMMTLVGTDLEDKRWWQIIQGVSLLASAALFLIFIHELIKWTLNS